MSEAFFIDTHAHLDDPRFNGDRGEVIKRASGAGITSIITVGCWNEQKGLGPVLDLIERYPFIYAALGIHPHDAKLATDGTSFELIRELAGVNNKIVAIGETGLDYHYMNSPKDVQRRCFMSQIRLASEVNSPLIVHSRAAEKDTLEILRGEGAIDCGGVVHCFSGTYNMAEECLEMGFYLSFTGAVTFPKAEGLRKLVKAVPIERILLETDCPYLAPVPHRGKRCEPSFVVETGRKIAELKELSLEDVARITTLNAEEVFGLGGLEKHSEPEGKIAYPIRNSLYLNITNRCTNYCTFCAKNSSYTVKGHYLKLPKEPDFDDVKRAVGPDPKRYDEVVFCGYGEPLIRLVLVKKVGLYLKEMGCRIRIDTDGLANLVHRRDVLPELKFVDCISVSLNAPDSETYQKIVNTPFKDRAYPAIVEFLREAKNHIPEVVATVVAVPGLDIEACRNVAEEDLGVAFRVREYNEVG
jgi:TatD DNase family protein